MLNAGLCFSNRSRNGDEIAKAKESELINNVTFPRIRQAVRNPVFVVFVFFFCLLICLFVCLLCLFSVYCVPNVASVSGLSIVDYTFGFLYRLIVLCVPNVASVSGLSILYYTFGFL
jgi:hypothetical protein